MPLERVMDPRQSLRGRILSSFVIAIIVGLVLGFLLGESLRSVLFAALGCGVGLAVAEAVVWFSERRSEPTAEQLKVGAHVD